MCSLCVFHFLVVCSVPVYSIIDTWSHLQDEASPTHTQEIALYRELAGNDYNVGLFDNGESLLKWWKEHAGLLSYVSRLARRYLAMPATSHKCSSRALVFSGWSSWNCEKSLSQPAHRNTSCVPARNPPGCAWDDGALDHQGNDCCVIQQDKYFMSSILHLCGNVYLCVNVCIYVWQIHMYVYMCTCTRISCTYIIKHVHICTCVNVIRYSTHKKKSITHTFEDKHVSYKLFLHI